MFPLSLTLFFLLFPFHPALADFLSSLQNLNCTLFSTNSPTATPPICYLNVNIHLQNDCSASFTERYVFPYTTAQQARLTISHIAQQQNVHMKNVFLNGQPLTSWHISHPQNNYHLDDSIISVPTSQSSFPSWVTLQYRLSNAVNRFSTSCKQTHGQMDDDTNVFRWRSPPWNLSIPVVNLEISTSNDQATLSPVYNNKFSVVQVSKQAIFFAANDVAQGTELYVAESGLSSCPTNLMCFERFRWSTCKKCHLSIIAIVIVSILVLGYLFDETRLYVQAVVIAFIIREIYATFQNWFKTKL